MKTEVYKQLSELLPLAEILYDEPMSKHTTFRVGGAADVFVRIASEEQLKVLIPELVKSEIPYYVIGKGSNLLVGDKGFRGVVIQLDEAFEKIKVNNNIVTACAGASMAKIAKTALQNSLTGFEFAAGIPGCVGGGVIMNAGAYGGEMKDVVSKVRVLCKDGNIKEYTNEAMSFGYRFSALKNKPEYIVLEVEIILEPGNEEEILAKMQDLAKRRKDKQPLEYPSAGSTFKRPEGYFAGKLIGDAGLSGYSVGDAEVSEKHNGFVINRGNATAADVRTLIETIQCKVYEQFGVNLEREVIYLGEF
ncbi:MAG: UDP-N-acetylmuramate dehydrogenase [Lachnospiraceae bacterium]|nr:UDP-N-acetylmuramate dehydrogenase [Lachnospiraceae bacterium]